MGSSIPGFWCILNFFRLAIGAIYICTLKHKNGTFVPFLYSGVGGLGIGAAHIALFLRKSSEKCVWLLPGLAIVATSCSDMAAACNS